MADRRTATPLATPRATPLADPRPSGADLRATWRCWTGTVTAAELCGFVAPAVVAALVVDLPEAPGLLALVAAGAVEGAVLGAGQARVIGRLLPGFEARTWTTLTAAAAALAWLLGLLPSATHDLWSTWPAWAQVVAGSALGSALLVSIGAAQALVLADHVPHPGRWVGWSVLGWAAGLAGFLLVATPLWHAGQPGWQVALVGVLAASVMAVTMAATTATGLVRLLRAVR